MPELKRVPVDDIEPPTRTEQLHPVKDDKSEEWVEFTDSVGTEPDKPVDVRMNGTGYELIDGDRRLAAVEENGGDDILCSVYDRDEVSDEEFYLRRLRANDHRKEDHPVRRSWYYAQFTAPWLIPPGDRFDSVELLNQAEFADEVGVSQPTVSNRLEKMRGRKPLRAVLGEIGSSSRNRPPEENIEKIDEIVGMLRGGAGYDHTVISESQVPIVSDEIEKMSSLSLSEVHSIAEEAVEEGWFQSEFLENLKGLAGSDEEVATGTIESGFTGSDTSKEQTFDGDPEKVDDGSGSLSVEDEEEDKEPEEVSVLGDPPEIDWSEYISDSDLPGNLTVEQVANRRRAVWEAEDDVAVAVKMMAEATSEDAEDVLHRHCGQAIVDSVVDYFVED